PLPSLPQMAQAAAADPAHLAHPSNSDHDANRGAWLLADAHASRGPGSSHRLASEHPQCADHHLPGAPRATMFPPMGALKNRSFPFLCLLFSPPGDTSKRGSHRDTTDTTDTTDTDTGGEMAFVPVGAG